MDGLVSSILVGDLTVVLADGFCEDVVGVIDSLGLDGTWFTACFFAVLVVSGYASSTILIGSRFLSILGFSYESIWVEL